MLFSVVCGLIDGQVTPDSFEDERFLDKDVLDLIGRTEVFVRDDFTKATPAIRTCRIIAETDGGEKVEAERMVTLEEIKRGMPQADVEAKFRENTRRTYSTTRQDQIIKAIGSVDLLDDISALSPLFTL